MAGSGNSTVNTTALIAQEVYLDTVLYPLVEPLLSQDIVVDVSQFSHGDTAHIPVMGSISAHDRQENDDPKFSAISTSRFDLVIDQHKESASYITKEQMENGYATHLLQNEVIPQQRQALLELYESSMLNLQSAQTSGNANNINGAPHRIMASGTSNVISKEDFFRAKYVLRKANVPDQQLICIVDPFTALELETSTNILNLSNNPSFSGFITSGLASQTAFARDIAGFKIFISDRLPTITTETIGGTTVTNGRTCLFMSLANNQVKPFCRAWRRFPEAKAEYNDKKDRLEMWIRSRYGFGLMRPSGLVTVIAKNPTSGFSV